MEKIVKVQEESDKHYMKLEEKLLEMENNTILCLVIGIITYYNYVHYTIKFIIVKCTFNHYSLMFLVIQILHYGISDSAWCTPTSTCWSGRWGRLLMSITLL